MPCKRSTLKKYRDRPSPPYPAQECQGVRKKGSDGEWWVSVADRFGVYRWMKGTQKKVHTVKGKKTSVVEKKQQTKRKGKGAMGTAPSATKRTYFVHHNGSRPFQVIIEEGKVKVYKLNESEGQTKATDGQKPVYQVTPRHVWLGDNYMAIPLYDGRRGEYVGNSILLQVGKSTYVFIGHEIVSFDTGSDEIVEYYSPVGNNDVPYPYAVGKEFAYFLLDNKRVPVVHLDLTKDGYQQFYHEISDKMKSAFKVKRIASCCE